MSEIQKYFDDCREYWKSIGNSDGVATSKAFWWDCCEIWNCDKSWDKDKIQFAKDFRNYTPYAEIPSCELIEQGGI